MSLPSRLTSTLSVTTLHAVPRKTERISLSDFMNFQVQVKVLVAVTFSIPQLAVAASVGFGRFMELVLRPGSGGRTMK